MAYYDVCPKCNAHLDPGERCDCEEEALKREKELRLLIQTDKFGQMVMISKKGGIKREKL